MSNEVIGLKKLIIGGIDQAVTSVKYGRKADMFPATTTGTAAGGKESAAGRMESPISIEAPFFDVLGTEIITGTLVANTHYLVTGGTITETLVPGSYASGTVFQSDGTGTASETNKVKPLGSLITGGTLAITIGGSTRKITVIDYVEKLDEFPATTTGTNPYNKDIATGRAAITSKIDMIMYDNEADDLVNASPTAKAIVITWKTGNTITGNAIFSNIDIPASVEGIVKVSASVEWQGVPTVVGCGYLSLGTSQTYKAIYKVGSTTNKEVAGYITLTGRTFSCDAEKDAKIVYEGKLTGAITPAVAN